MGRNVRLSEHHELVAVVTARRAVLVSIQGVAAGVLDGIAAGSIQVDPEKAVRIKVQQIAVGLVGEPYDRGAVGKAERSLGVRILLGPDLERAGVHGTGVDRPIEADGEGSVLQRKPDTPYGNDPISWEADVASPGTYNK